MMRRVVASGNAVDIVELRAVESPIANEFFSELLEICLDFRHCRAKSCEVASHARVLAVLVEDEPVRMFLHDLRDDVLVRLPSSLPVFYANREPPELRENSLPVKFVDHLLDGVTGKRVAARIPISVSVEPTVVERGPLNAELFQLRDGSKHLLGSDVEFVSPSAPADVVGLTGGLGNVPTFFLQNARPDTQRFVEISAVNGDETARGGVGVARLQHAVYRNREACVDEPVLFNFHGNRESPGESFDMADGLTNRRRPECGDRNAATVAAFHRFAHCVRKRRSARELENIVLAPVVTRALKRPHVIRLRLRIGVVRAEAVLLHPDLIELKVRVADILVSGADQSDVWEVVVGFDDKGAVDLGSGRGERARWKFDSLAASQLASCFGDLCFAEVGNEVEFLAFVNDRIAAAGGSDFGLVERQQLAVFHQRRLQKAGGQNMELRRTGSD